MSRIASACRLFLLAGALATPTVAHAQNQVQNPNFSLGTAGNWTNWTVSFDAGCGGACTAANDNLNGFPSPGTPAARLTSTSPGNTGTTLISDCTAFTGSTLDIGTFEHVNTLSGTCFRNYFFNFWSDAACTSLLSFSAVASLGSVGGGWEQFGADNFAPGAAGGFFNITVQVRCNAGGGTGDVSFDHFYIGPDGTTPVELESFTVD
jgi:hypothetical protein